MRAGLKSPLLLCIIIGTMKLCYLDLETTCLNAQTGAIVQLSGLLQSGTDVKEFDIRVRPHEGAEISRISLQQGGLTATEVLGYTTTSEEAYHQFIKLLSIHVNRYDKADKYFLLGYNVSFDERFLREWFSRNGDEYFGSWFWFPPLDIMQLAAFHLVGERPLLENFKLKTVYKTITGKDLEEAHNSAADIAATKEILNAIWSKWKVAS